MLQSTLRRFSCQRIQWRWYCILSFVEKQKASRRLPPLVSTVRLLACSPLDHRNYLSRVRGLLACSQVDSLKLCFNNAFKLILFSFSEYFGMGCILGWDGLDRYRRGQKIDFTHVHQIPKYKMIIEKYLFNFRILRTTPFSKR